MPGQEMVKLCKEENVWSIIDVAHSIGQEPNINLSEAQPDFWGSARSYFCFPTWTRKADTPL